MNIEILTLPVYRLNEDKYYEQQAEYLDRSMNRGSLESDELREEFYASNPQLSYQLKEYLINKFGGCWEFNEIIGYIKLHFLGSQIRGEYFEVKAKRIIRTRKKTFRYVTHKLAPELEVKRGAKNSEIFEIVSEYVAHCYKELPKGRFIDDRQLKSLGAYLDWRALIESSM